MAKETHPLIKQVCGAVAGMALALGAYGIWVAASPLLPSIDWSWEAPAPTALQQVGERARALAADLLSQPHPHPHGRPERAAIPPVLVLGVD